MSAPRTWLVAIGFAALCGCMGDARLKLHSDGTTPDDPSFIPPDVPATRFPCALPAPRPIANLSRLSNHEYRQVASDLLGVDVPATRFARWTPIAEVQGFDTMAEARIDGQGLTEQLATAEVLGDQLLESAPIRALCPPPEALPAPSCTLKAAYDPVADFGATQATGCWSYLDSTGALMTFDGANNRWAGADPGSYVWNTGMHPGGARDAQRRWTVAQDGELHLVGSFADADPGGGDGVTVTVKRGTTTVWNATLANGSSDTFDLTFTVRRGETFDFIVNRTGDASYDTTAFTATLSLVQPRNVTGWTWANCGAPIASHVGSRLFRRPLRTEEVADYAALFATTTSQAQAAGILSPNWYALQAVVQAVLSSPSVMYKSEQVPGGLDASEKGFAIASRLSLYFCSSYPDAELSALAASGQLTDAPTVAAQAERLLAKCGARFAENFAGQWLGFRAPLDVADVTPLTLSMRHEAAGVFADVVSRGASPQRLISPGATVVDQPLAEFYGLPFGPIDGSPEHRISSGLRGGLFAQGYFLTSTSTGSEFKRVIHRGVWTLNRTLCESLPELNAATLQQIAMSLATIDPTLPLPKQMEAHRGRSEVCYSCHGTMDPLGLALEKFDKNAQWRETYADGAPIVNDFDFHGTRLQSPQELAAFIELSPKFRRCVASKLLTYALSRQVNDDEKVCVPESLAYPLDGHDASLKELALEAATTSLRLTGELP